MDPKKYLIITFLPDDAEEAVRSFKWSIEETQSWITVPARDDIINHGGMYWRVVQQVHEFGQHEHNLCLSVAALPRGEKPPYPVHLRSFECVE